MSAWPGLPSAVCSGTQPAVVNCPTSHTSTPHSTLVSWLSDRGEGGRSRHLQLGSKLMLAGLYVGELFPTARKRKPGPCWGVAENYWPVPIWSRLRWLDTDPYRASPSSYAAERRRDRPAPARAAPRVGRWLTTNGLYDCPGSAAKWLVPQKTQSP
jgi:hypothetical protein